MANNYTQFSEALAEIKPEGIAWLKEQLEEGGPFEGCCEFEFETESSLWIYAEESGDLEQTVDLVQQYLQKFDPDYAWTMTWASWCGKPRIGEFGGGAVVVTATEQRWMNTWDWVENKLKEMKVASDASGTWKV